MTATDHALACLVKPIGLADWTEAHRDVDYCRVARDWVGTVEVSTVWLGIDHGFVAGVPLIFETMRIKDTDRMVSLVGPGGMLELPERLTLEFPDPETADVTTMLRYTSEEEALAAHHEILRRLRLREGH